jgi:Protein of unknown function (DUF835)
VNDPRRPPEPAGASAPGASDDDYARAYSEGYGEGLREALREVLQHASRGHTASELRLLIESRLARVHEDVELKRKNLLSPPRRPSWGAMLRAPSAPAGVITVPTRSEPAPAGPGDSFLFREVRPARALAMVGASAARYRRIVVASLRPVGLAGVPEDRITFLQIATGNVPGAISDPGRLAGEIRSAVEAAGGALVYLDAFETLTTEAGVETMLKFVTWLASEATTTGSVVVVSVDPATLDPTVLSRLQRPFKFVP